MHAIHSLRAKSPGACNFLAACVEKEAGLCEYILTELFLSVLSHIIKNRPKWQRCIDVLDSSVGWVFLHVCVSANRYFMLQDFDFPVTGGPCERNYHLNRRMFWKSAISQKAFFFYSSAPLQRYVENGFVPGGWLWKRPTEGNFGGLCTVRSSINLKANISLTDAFGGAEKEMVCTGLEIVKCLAQPDVKIWRP